MPLYQKETPGAAAGGNRGGRATAADTVAQAAMRRGKDTAGLAATAFATDGGRDGAWIHGFRARTTQRRRAQAH